MKFVEPFRRARLSLSALGVILAYHRVASSAVDPHQLCVSEERFRDQMTALRDRLRPVRLADVPTLVGSGSRTSARFFVVTFDDGYVDNLKSALPILEALGVPATVFITVDNMNTGTPYWWDRLATLLLSLSLLVRTIELTVCGQVWTHDVGSAAARGQAHSRLQGMLRDLPPAEIDSVLSQLADLCHPAMPQVDAMGAPMTREEVALLAKSPVIDIGSHGLSHGNLTTVPPSALADETRAARRTLEEVTEQPVLSFSYPFGERNEAAQDAVAAAGYRVACGFGGPVRATDDRRCYGRMLVRDWPTDAFVSSMRRYLST